MSPLAMLPRRAHGCPMFASVCAVRVGQVALDRLLFALLVLALGAFAPRPAQAEIAATVTSEQSGYLRGQTNTFVFHIAVASQVFENADNIHFRFPDGIVISAARFVDGFPNCPDALLLVLGMGTPDGGWFNPGHPSGCGFFSGFPDGAPQVFSIDADIPAGYSGDLPVLISVEGDGCCDPPPHDASVTMTFADSASPASWNFDDDSAPALPAGWSTQTAHGGVAWITVPDAMASAPNAAFAPTPPRRGESSLISAAVAIDPAGGELRFRHRFAMDAGHDGGVVEIAIDGGAFEDIIAAGGTFRAGAYNSQIDASAGCSGGNVNPLLGRAAYSGAQQTYTDVAIRLPDAASGHQVQARWRLGTDCGGQVLDAAGWWIDDVRVVPAAPAASIGPDKLAVALDANLQRSETIGIGNVGGGTLGFTLTTAATDSKCSDPSPVPWLQVVTASGTVAAGERSEVAIALDSTALPAGLNEALICVATNDGTNPVVPIAVSLLVTPDACIADDRLFRDGFESTAASARSASADLCNGSLRTFSRRDAFMAAITGGFAEDHYTGLRSGQLFGPITFGNDTFSYSVFTEDKPINPSLRLIPGSGVLSATSSGDQLTLTFTGAPVTAIGGDFRGNFFSLYMTPLVASATIVLTLDDGSSETFVSRSGEDFRGFVSSRPIRSLSVATPVVDETLGDFPWGVIDNLVVGSAR